VLKDKKGEQPMKTIFVVDDNRTNLIMAEEALSEHFDVLTLLSAALMFNLLEEVKPDLILLDIMMPEMDGFKALKLLKENPEYADIPVVFLTGKSYAAAEARRSHEMGALDIIYKPFSKEVLLERINSLLNKGGKND
jgi:CheY-like chemotaxis protein